MVQQPGPRCAACPASPTAPDAPRRRRARQRPPWPRPRPKSTPPLIAASTRMLIPPSLQICAFPTALRYGLVPRRSDCRARASTLGLVRREREPERARAAAGSMPIASRTWLGCGHPRCTPSRSSTRFPGVRATSASCPSAAGEREVRVARQTWISVEYRVRHCGPHGIYQLVAQCCDLLRCARRGAPRRAHGRRSAWIAARRTVPDRNVASWPPHAATASTARLAEQERADTDRTAELVPGHGQRARAGLREVDRNKPTACTASVVKRDAVLSARLGQLLIGLTVPTSLFAHMAVTSATSSDDSSSFKCFDVQPACAVEGARSPRRRRGSLSQSAASSTAWCSTTKSERFAALPQGAAE